MEKSTINQATMGNCMKKLPSIAVISSEIWFGYIKDGLIGAIIGGLSAFSKKL